MAKTLLGKRLKEVGKSGSGAGRSSRKVRIPAVMISGFETGVRKNPSAATLVKLANAVDFDGLLARRTDVPTPWEGLSPRYGRWRAPRATTTFDAVYARSTKHLTDQERARGEARGGD